MIEVGTSIAKTISLRHNEKVAKSIIKVAKLQKVAKSIIHQRYGFAEVDRPSTTVDPVLGV